MNKKEAEKTLLKHIKDIGLVEYCSMWGEGHKRNNEYYQFVLKDGTRRYFTNPSEYFKKEIEIE